MQSLEQFIEQSKQFSRNCPNQMDKTGMDIHSTWSGSSNSCTKMNVISKTELNALAPTFVPELPRHSEFKTHFDESGIKPDELISLSEQVAARAATSTLTTDNKVREDSLLPPQQYEIRVTLDALARAISYLLGISDSVRQNLQQNEVGQPLESCIFCHPIKGLENLMYIINLLTTQKWLSRYMSTRILSNLQLLHDSMLNTFKNAYVVHEVTLRPDVQYYMISLSNTMYHTTSLLKIEHNIWNYKMRQVQRTRN